MSRIVLGETPSSTDLSILANANVALKKLYLDIDSLIRNRLLVQANSGGGKSYLLRTIAEQLSGKIQVIIIDSEGEFPSLREKYPYVLAGKGGETSADPRTAALLAGRLLELHASAILDIYEMKPDSRHAFVMNFLDAMIDAPKSLWHPVVVILDEAHVFCPEKGQGESVAAESVINMASRGRKRGFALVAATQRLGKLSKNCTAELSNVIIGKTFQDIDRKRAAETLGIYGKDTHDFFDAVKLLKPGMFFALGPSISETRVVFRGEKAETTHPEAGAGRHISPPATPANIEKFLPKLSDLPAEQEKKEQTVKELNEQIKDLRKQLRDSKANEYSVEVTPPKVTKTEILQTLQAEIAPYKRELRDQRSQLRDLMEFSKKTVEKLRDVIALTETHLKDVKLSEFNPADPDLKEIQNVLSSNTAKHNPIARSPLVSAPDPPTPVAGLTDPQSRILRALMELRGSGCPSPDVKRVAAWAGYTVNGHFNNIVGSLSTAGLVRRPGDGTVVLTEEGAVAVGKTAVPDLDEIRRRVMDRLDAPGKKLMTVMLQRGIGSVATSEDLALSAGYTVNGHFNNIRGSLVTQGLLEYTGRGTLKAADWLFES